MSCLQIGYAGSGCAERVLNPSPFSKLQEDVLMISSTGESALGLCIGASTIKIVELKCVDGHLRLGRTQVLIHNCDTRDSLRKVLSDYPLESYQYVCVTGRKHRNLINLPSVTEPEAVELAMQYLLRRYPEEAPRVHAVLILGSENFIAYELNAAGAIAGVRTSNKCASGTGEFFLQQLRRMDIPLAGASEMARAAEPYAVCGRCSVFCKSDCTHALNKGIPADRVLAGLGNMIADKALEILGAIPRRNIMVVGGVTNNTYVMDELRSKIEDLFVPVEADVFEAIGAAACALHYKTRSPTHLSFATSRSSFGALPPLREAEHLVTFREGSLGHAQPGDVTVLGLDVGSTTTKAVLMRTADSQVLASVYLRTNGNPIRASRQCYREILRQLAGTDVTVSGVGVTGSGRYIAGLHAQSPAIINEIIAHATAAAYFDPDVDTIFEIGGQDAKYTYLVNGVPCDYAMNEACSAGTGSFLEEAAKESLEIDYREIQTIALRAKEPRNFNDQCAAFISSDIRNASHDIGHDDIVAGLVYSICMNYSNRVKGSRKVGKRVFMQGGVCYNRAVPLAMASLLQVEIIVPPDPGLMGAFGVALEARQRMEMGVLKPGSFDLEAMAVRDVSYGKTFNCPGTSERCDRGCDINVIKLNGKSYPFGGACNKYYNIAGHRRIESQPYDFVARRQQALFVSSPPPLPPGALSVGISRSFLCNLLFPLYVHFFSCLGYRIVLPDEVDPEGAKRTNSSFCHPAVIAHGMLLSLIKRKPDIVFLPHIHELHVENGHVLGPGHQSTCVTALAEPYYLRSAFQGELGRIVSPHLNFAGGWKAAKAEFIRLAEQLGHSADDGAMAFERGSERLAEFFAARKRLGRESLAEMEKDPHCVGIVLFGRAYNAFAKEANLGIPQKFASRGVHIIPCDCLPFDHEPSIDTMNWASGHDLLRAASVVKKHPQLFGAFVTNFGCGPDSFLVGYFRDIMKTKPSLTLEIDSHTQDAGVNTRVEAFLDIVERYRRLRCGDAAENPFRRAELVMHGGKAYFRDSQGRDFSLRDPRVKVVFPSMGRTLVEASCATFRGFGVRAEPVPLPDHKTLMAGRGNTCCKECLPLILSVGSLVEYLERVRQPDDLLVYFMPSTNGNCRFPQYSVFLQRLIEQKRMENVAIFTLTSENGYSGLGSVAAGKFVRSVIVADVMDDVKNAMLVLAKDRQQAFGVFDVCWQDILDCLAGGGKNLHRLLVDVAQRLAAVPRRAGIDEVKHVLLAGEIFVRRDEFSSQRVIETLAEKGIVVQRASVLEWVQFIDYWNRCIEKRKRGFAERLEVWLRMLVMNRLEKRIKNIFASTGFYRYEVTDIERVLEAGERFVDRSFGGEALLVIGRFIEDMLTHFHGMISIGPFACMPTRIIDSILTPEAKRLHSLVPFGPDGAPPSTVLPFLSIETDGSPFPQTIEARLEAFCIQVLRTPQLAAHAS